MKKLILILALMLASFASSHAQTVATRVLGDTTSTNRVIFSETGVKVFAIMGYSASTQYIVVYQNPAGRRGYPVNNGTFKGVMSVPVAAGQFYCIDFGYYGADLDNLIVVNSTSPYFITFGAADTTFQAIVRR